LAVAAVRRAHRDGGRRVHRRDAALPPGSRPGPPREPGRRAAGCDRDSGNRVTYSVRSATVRFGRTVALDDVTVEVPAGSAIAVVGGAGAGQSTPLPGPAG